MRTWFKPSRPIQEPWRRGTDEILDVCFANRSIDDEVSYPWPERMRIKREVNGQAYVDREAFLNFTQSILSDSERKQRRGDTTLGVLEMQELAECGG